MTEVPNDIPATLAQEGRNVACEVVTLLFLMRDMMPYEDPLPPLMYVDPKTRILAPLFNSHADWPQMRASIQSYIMPGSENLKQKQADREVLLTVQTVYDCLPAGTLPFATEIDEEKRVAAYQAWREEFLPSLKTALGNRLMAGNYVSLSPCREYYLNKANTTHNPSNTLN